MQEEIREYIYFRGVKEPEMQNNLFSLASDGSIMDYKLLDLKQFTTYNLPSKILGFRHTRGFGIHSPFAFHLITGILRDRKNKWKYPLSLEVGLSAKDKKFYRVIFRLCRGYSIGILNYSGTNADRLSSFVQKGYPELLIKDEFSHFDPETDLYVFEKYTDISCESFLATGVNKDKRVGVLLRNIHKDPSGKTWWRLLKKHAEVCIDMRHCGLLFFDSKLQPGIYFINI